MKNQLEKPSHFVDELQQLWLHTERVTDGFTDLQCYNISFRNCPKILEKADLGCGFFCVCVFQIIA